MKLKIHVVILAALSFFNIVAGAPQPIPAPPPPTPSPISAYIDSISLAPIGAIKTAGFSGASQWGAGLDLGVSVNPFVSIHVANLAFEGPKGQDSFGGLLVDETDILVKAKISRFSTDSFGIYGIGGANRNWDTQDWGFSVGLGAELAFNKHLSLIADYSLRAWFNHPKDSLGRAGINFSF